MRIASPTFRALVMLIALPGGLLASRSVSATVIAEDGFAYTTGDLNGENGGSGDWKDSWTGDSELDVTLGGWGYTDSLGNELLVSGEHIELDSDPGGYKKAERSMNDKVGVISETVWFSAILDGTASSEIHHISLSDGVSFGQGYKDQGATTWMLGDQDGLIQDTGLSSNARAFLVVRIDFTGGDEDVWLWVDPLLDSAPSTASADASGVAKSFEADKIFAHLESYGDAGFDEVRLGTSFVDVVPIGSVPDPDTLTLLGAGLVLLAAVSRERRGPRLRASGSA
ncbi:MAG: hypothetical protein JRH19_28445 [Deltaproteobacteria bacterium]|nr:hypothetical protein [Deltaproteobacteria bacterium]